MTAYGMEVICVGTADVKCPECGTMNYSLYLEETDGWMECENCGCTVHLRKEKMYVPAPGENSRWTITEAWPLTKLAV